MTKVNPIPQDHRGATPYICCKDAASALDFYRKAFGATETMRLAEPGGKIGHAEFKIGDATIMLADEYPEMGVRSPQSIGGSSVSIHIYVADVDAFADRAVGAGAKLLRPVADQFYGERSAWLEDPYGHRWNFASRKEELSNAELQRRYDELMKK